MKTKIITVTLLIMAVTVLTGFSCQGGNKTTSNNITDKSGSSKEVTDRTDYTIFYTDSSAAPLGGMTYHQYIVGHSLADSESIKYNAYLTPWKISFSQVQRTDLSMYSSVCQNLTEQVVYIDGYIEIDFSDLGITADQLPDAGPFYPKGTIHETVSGTPGTWSCPDSAIATTATNDGSVQYVQSISGEHTANFEGVSNMTNLTVAGAEIYLDFSYNEDIQLIWPAGTKIEYAPAGTTIPLEPLSSNSL
ncbi:MAG: hypothetical protein ABIE68_04920 [bacterium]